MAQYSIKDIEYLTGIKAHTIRIWEQRYNLITPHRTDTNIRYYDDDQLKLMLNIGILNANGYKISKIASMDEKRFSSVLKEVTEQNSINDSDHESSFYQLLNATLDLNEALFERTINKVTLKIGFDRCFMDVVMPFLNRIGILWTQDSLLPAHEHFLSNLVTRKLKVAIDGQALYPKDDAKTILLFLPEKEMHDIGLLFSHYLLKKHGQRCIYLGPDVPSNDIHEICKKISPDLLLTIFTIRHSVDLNEYLSNLLSNPTTPPIFISGRALADFDLKENKKITVFRDYDDLLVKLNLKESGN